MTGMKEKVYVRKEQETKSENTVYFYSYGTVSDDCNKIKMNCNEMKVNKIYFLRTHTGPMGGWVV